MGWPPQVGELLPRADEAIGVRYKLETYSLDINHRDGGPKAKGFALILGITVDAIVFLEDQIHKGICSYPIIGVAGNHPYGLNCVVEFPICGSGRYSDRVALLRTVWELASPHQPPRMINAFLRT